MQSFLAEVTMSARFFPSLCVGRLSSVCLLNYFSNLSPPRVFGKLFSH